MLRLRTQIFLAAFALGILPLLTLVAINLSGHIRRHEEVGRQQLRATLNLEFASLENRLDHYRDDLHKLALLPEIQELVAGDPARPAHPLPELLAGWFNGKPEILAITIRDDQNRILGNFVRQGAAFIQTGSRPGEPTGRDRLTLATTVASAKGTLTCEFLLDSQALLADYHNAYWINAKGFYQQKPPVSALATGSNAFEDFPGLAEKLAGDRPELLETDSGFTVAWLPLYLNTAAPDLWLGNLVDQSGAVQWKDALIRNIITIILVMSALLFVIASLIARKVDLIKEQILAGLERVMNRGEEFRFSWSGPREITAMAEELSQLASRYVATSKGRQEAEAALLENQENFRNLANSAQDAIILMDHQGNISYWNQTAEEMFGYSEAEALGQPLHHLIATQLPAEESGRESRPERAAGSGPIRETIELIARRKNNSELPVELSLSEARIKERWHSIWIIRDISERKWAEEKTRLQQQQLVQADKMASLGLLVSGVAHEINNPNSIALLNTPMLARAWESVRPILEEHYREHGDFTVAGLDYSEMREQVPRLFQELEESAKRIRTIVKDLKDYVRKDPAANAEPVDLNQVCRTAVRLTGNMLKKHTDNFREDYQGPLPPLTGNRQRLEQVVINLLQNSCEALPDRTAGITLATGASPDGKQVWLQVSDQGGGIPQEALKQLTDPFYTTKRTSGGTGLGLSVSAGIVKEHGGNLDFASSPQGTKVRVSFPAAAGKNS
ncbi:MAG TPA: ATP-binding protein [Desulfurivibrionaceae bacterium]|nr:ATP-binding protein [Desulfurivibrionaceae bacterium]